jgi:hypothetical protein
MKKSLAALATVVMLFAACGKEGTTENILTAGESSPTPSASAAADAAESAQPDATATAAAATDEPTATQASGTSATSAPAKPAPAGKSQPPKNGRYVYSYSGKATDPANPAGGQQSYNGELYNEISHSGNVYTLESTNSESAGRSIVKTRWTDTRVEFLEIKIETQIGTFGCKFNPALVITKFPIKPETYPTQNFKGEGNACDGKLDITIEAKETVKDAAGKAFETWRAKVNTEIKSDSLSIVQKETRWASPDLGVEIRSVGSQNGEVKSGAFQSKFSGTSNSVLKQRP